ncbi:ketosteroid isomerase [Mycobacterium sp. Soil538]|nr:ketosteroid isomerase [Mycobacterium sp. Soil538]
MSATDVSTVLDVADRLFGAIEDSDVAGVEQLFSADIAVRKTGDDRDNDRRRSVRIIGWLIDSTIDRRYEVLDRQVFGGGFVQQHILHAHGRNGAMVAMRVCIVIKVGADGLITRIDEYFDPADIAPLLADS